MGRDDTSRTIRRRVAEAMGDGASLEEVEATLIRPAPLPAELRDALWLYAWELGERLERGRHLPPARAPSR